MEKLLRFTQKRSVGIASLVLSFALFGQVFLSSIVNVLSLDNRFVMLIFRLCLMLINVSYILFSIFQKKSLSFFSKSWINVVAFFWSLYIIRLFYDVFVAKVSLSVPYWELMAWGLGSSCCGWRRVFRFIQKSRSSFIQINRVWSYFAWNIRHLLRISAGIRARWFLFRSFKCNYCC